MVFSSQGDLHCVWRNGFTLGGRDSPPRILKRDGHHVLGTGQVSHTDRIGCFKPIPEDESQGLSVQRHEAMFKKRRGWISDSRILAVMAHTPNVRLDVYMFPLKQIRGKCTLGCLMGSAF